MAGLNIFKRDTNKPRLSIRERFRNAAARVMPRSRKSRAGGGADVSRRAVMAGSLATAAVLPFPAAASDGDAILMDAWAKFQDAMARNSAFNAQIEPLFRAAVESLPEHPFKVALAAGRHRAGTTVQDISEEERMAYEDVRGEQYQEAWDRHGVTPLQREQDRFLEEVVWPLAETIRNTTPTTIQGAAIKARYLLENENSPILRTEAIESLDAGDAALRQLVEQLAALA
ncbi:hypothetical protein HPT29_028490 (plasmid) [Microvirga terrae]|uniref:DUF885 domain-containing protein n=1 Tax=Microvirga terrae TaxID=2740529 RepID=A0ABY5S388_9HYPH|nr:hypothetical protein [Microvirga terrae]UVF22842.1 hypothetical protein HPT29_028490 [Microvirga terrae]